MIQTHPYLFLQDEGFVYRYKFRRNTEEESIYELFLYSNNERCKEYTDDFWNEWKDAVGFLDGDKVDFAFLSDNDQFRFVIPPDFSLCNPSQFFSHKRIRAFIEKNFNCKITLIYKGRKDTINSNDEKFSGQKVFYLDIPFPSGNFLNTSIPSIDYSFTEYSLGDFCAEEKEGWRKHHG